MTLGNHSPSVKDLRPVLWVPRVGDTESLDLDSLHLGSHCPRGFLDLGREREGGRREGGYRLKRQDVGSYSGQRSNYSVPTVIYLLAVCTKVCRGFMKGVQC